MSTQRQHCMWATCSPVTLIGIDLLYIQALRNLNRGCPRAREDEAEKQCAKGKKPHRHTNEENTISAIMLPLCTVQQQWLIYKLRQTVQIMHFSCRVLCRPSKDWSHLALVNSENCLHRTICATRVRAGTHSAQQESDCSCNEQM